jgi:hypothetical protein
MIKKLRNQPYAPKWKQEVERKKKNIIQTESGVHPTFYPMGTGGYFLGVKRLGRETDNPPPTSAEDKKMWIYTSTPPYVFMA